MRPGQPGGRWSVRPSVAWTLFQIESVHLAGE